MRMLVALSIFVLALPIAGCASRPGPYAEFSPSRGHRSTAVPAMLTSGGRETRAPSLLLLGLN